MEQRAAYATPPAFLNQGQALRAVEEASALSALENRLSKLADLNHTQNGQIDALLDQLLGCQPCGATAGPPTNAPGGQLDRLGNCVTELEIASERRQDLIRRLSRV